MSTPSADVTAPALVYPFAVTPAPADAIEVAPGVRWLRMPLPIAALNHINVYALEDAPGWTVVDTGMHTPYTTGHWQSALAGPLGARPVTRVICTHMHPDHVGVSGWLTREYGCRLWMTRLEYITCRMLVADTGREAPQDGIEFFRAAGWGEDALTHYRERFGGFGKAVYTLPDSYHRVAEGETLSIGAHSWRAVIGRGHSPEHLCLYSPQLRLLISGDQVLPRITSNVSVYPTEPDANPLRDWLESLAAIKRQVPDDVLVLPSHNEPFRGLHARLDVLISGHEERLERMYGELSTPKRAVDVFKVLFRRQIGVELLSMATGESLAHLNCLIGRGQAVCETHSDGVRWYRRA
jgi:glyoxylase-like metal-dependent hydrolase (beta-lactamase superfamily II)